MKRAAILASILSFWAFAVALPSRVSAADPILSASEIAYPPFCIVDDSGRVGGFSVELMQAALKAMGREVSFRTGPWNEVKGWLEHGQVQALPLVGRTPERDAIFDFTFPYMSQSGAIVVRAGTSDIQVLSDLRGRSVAVMKGDTAEEFLSRKKRGIQIHTTATFEDALRQLAAGSYDAVFVQRLVAVRLIQETGLKNLKVINRPVEDFRQDFCFAVREGDRDTLALLNEGLALVTADGTYRHLHAKWFAALELPVNRRIVIGGDENYPPYEYLDGQGRPAGYNVELTRAIALEMGLDIEIRLGPWTEILNGLEKGEIDAIQGMFYSPHRDLTFDFSPPHIVNHCVAVVRRGQVAPPSSVPELAGKRLVVERGDIMHDFAEDNGLGPWVVPVATQEEALRELAAGKHDCALVSRLTAFYWIEKHGWHNLMVAQRPLLSPGYGYAVPNGHKAMLASLSEGLQVLEKKGEYQRIYDRWLGVYEPSQQNLNQVLRAVALGALPLLAVVLALFVWTRTLRRQVAKQTEELRQSESRYRLLAENTLDVIWTMNLDLEFTYVNPAVFAMTGHRPEEWIGSALSDHCDEESFAHTVGVILAEMEKGPEGTGAFFETEMLKKNGEAFWIEIHGKVIYDQTGQAVALQGTTRDISDRKRSEAALRESELRFRQFAELAPVAIVISDLEERVIYASPKFSALFGYTALDMPSVREWWQLAYPDPVLRNRFRQEWEAAVTRARNSLSEIKPMQHPVTCKDGSVRQVEFRMAAAGQFNLVVLVDVTERQQAEKEKIKLQEQLHQAQKMEAVGRLAGGVAHDFNNMLGVIMGYTELAKQKIAADDSLVEDLDEILAAANRSADITRQLLAFARKQTIVPHVLDLNDTVEGMLKMLRRLIGEDIDLQWLPEDGLWPIKIDPSQLNQILANLLVNARDAIDGVGKVGIGTDNAVFDAVYCNDHPGFVPGEYVMLAVSDNGRGMDQETLANLFEPFFTTKEMGRGTGLGLATVYGIVKQNEGFINVYSEPGQGTTFRIYLPRHSGKVEVHEAPPAGQEAAGRGETILVVEDEVSVLKLAQIILGGLGYTVLSAGGPAEAIRLAEAHGGRVDLLITDVVMPEMNGRDLAARLHEMYPQLKVLFMSGYTANTIAHHGVLDAGVHFIEKPFSREALAAQVKAALEG